MEWRRCVDFPDYEVSEQGDVRRVIPARGGIVGRVLRPWVRPDGYRMYIMRKGGRSFHPRAHQLVVTAFVGPRPFEGAEVCHNDSNRSNDHFTNLRWDTRAGNHADKVANGTAPRGEGHGGHKLKSTDVAEIKSLAAAGVLQREIADRFGVRQPQISRILAGVRRAHG